MSNLLILEVERDLSYLWWPLNPKTHDGNVSQIDFFQNNTAYLEIYCNSDFSRFKTNLIVNSKDCIPKLKL